MSSLPYAHNLWKCAFAADFEEGKWSGAWGRRFFESLTDKQFLACSYHQIADWQSVAKISVQLFRRFRSQPMSNLDAAMSQLTLEEQDPRTYRLGREGALRDQRAASHLRDPRERRASMCH